MNKIETAHEYFEQVVSFNLHAYKNAPGNLPAAYNLANALFSMHEWMWHTYGSGLGADLRNAGAFNAHVQTACPSFKYMRDVANASKHFSLSSPSTQATHITDTTAIQSKWGEGIWGVSKYGRSVVVIDDGGTKVDFENTADEVVAYWEGLLEQLGKNPRRPNPTS